jgi:hypothetical protein
MLNNLQMILENSKVEATSESLPIVNTVLNDAVFKPMLFSTPMVQALLNGTKTQTRRLVKFPNNYYGGEVYPNGRFGLKFESKDDCESQVFWRLNAQINIGDIIWVRETFKSTYTVDANDREQFIYKTDSQDMLDFFEHSKWKPSLFMPKRACRIWLKVTNVRCEPLQNISVLDSVAEGIEFKTHSVREVGMPKIVYKLYYAENHWDESPIISYWSLWDKINGKESWAKNPWVYVYEFEVIRERPYGFI